jgi:hypothetical protein
MPSSYVVARTSIDGLADHDAMAFWRDHVRHNHGELDYTFDRAESFRGSTVVQRGGSYQLVEFWSDPIAYTRTREQVDADDDRTIRIVLPRRGAIEIDGPQGVRHDSAGSSVGRSNEGKRRAET